MMFFNLLDEIVTRRTDSTNLTREFSPPLAALVPPDGDRTPYAMPADLPPAGTYTFSEQYTEVLDDANNANDVTNDIALTINIAGSFPADPEANVLPPTPIRVHAMVRGRLGFRPPNTVVLWTDFFTTSLNSGLIPWWRNWLDANTMPREIIYDNVDIVHFKALLRKKLDAFLSPGGLSPASAQGWVFPGVKGSYTREQFLADFEGGAVDANGAPAAFVSVLPGAVIGRAATGGAGHRLGMRVRYSDHLKPPLSKPQPMNPRELFYLCFGDNSTVAQNHRLLTDLNRLPSPAPAPRDEMTMRPPLRTWKRLMWESEREATEDLKFTLPDKHWSADPGGDLGTPAGRPRLFDTKFRREGRRVTYAGIPVDTNKCNIFTSEICVRSGFRATIFKSPPTLPDWHYVRANSHVSASIRSELAATNPPGRYPIMGVEEDFNRQWGWSLTHLVVTRAKTIAQLNAMMHEHGRALIIAGARPGTGLNNPPPFKQVSGHIVLVREFPAQITFPPKPPAPTPPPVTNPQLATNTDPFTVGISDMIQVIGANTAQATGKKGAVANEPYFLQLGGGIGVASGATGFYRIQLMEACPGRDPDVLQGAWDLHVKVPERIWLSSGRPDIVP